ncbi:MAG: hypothetical protein PF495_12165, partial [Spirochaetales bacterium]|nr:hypothetical protein [Spirochaetales bacterium]
ITALNRATIAPAVSDTESFDLGGVVSDLIFNSYDHEIGEGQSPWVGVLVNITIKYNTDLFDMDNYSA